MWCAMLTSTQCKQRTVKCEVDSCQVYDIGVLQNFSFPHDGFIKKLLTAWLISFKLLYVIHWGMG